jgi:hypothetical protein
MARRNEAATGAEGDLSSPVGEGPSPARQDDRPAPDSAGEETERKTGLEPNSAQTPAAGTDADAMRARRFALLQAFIRAARKIVMRLVQGAPDAPAPDRPTGSGGKLPPDTQPR